MITMAAAAVSCCRDDVFLPWQHCGASDNIYIAAIGLSVHGSEDDGNRLCQLCVVNNNDCMISMDVNVVKPYGGRPCLGDVCFFYVSVCLNDKLASKAIFDVNDVFIM